MPDDVVLTLRVRSCRDCPRFKMREVAHFLIGPSEVVYEFICTKAGRYITPRDGVKPPPSWCPLRKEQTDA